MRAMSKARSPVAFGRYLITRRIARGGMAEIYRARTRPRGAEEGAWVALKMMRTSLEHEALRSRLFDREARIASLIDHPNVVPVYEYGHELGRAYLAMEYVLGRDLSHLLRDQQDEPAPLPVDLALYIGFCAASGLGHAHRLADEAGRPLGIVHRDVSPGNIMIGYEGAVKVLDFGVARMNETHGARTQTGTLRGKFAYMSPEQTRGEQLDARSDVFSLGTVLYELLTGHNCFRAANPIATLDQVQNLRPLPPSQVDSHISKDVDRLLARCLAKEHGKRFADCEALKVALSDYLGDFVHAGRKRLVEHFSSRFEWSRHEEHAELDREAEEAALLEVVDFVQGGSDAALDAARVIVPEEEEASELEMQQLSHRTIDALDADAAVFDAKPFAGAPRAGLSMTGRGATGLPKTGDTKPALLFDDEMAAGRRVNASSLLDQAREGSFENTPPKGAPVPLPLPAGAIEFGETQSTVMVPVHRAQVGEAPWRARLSTLVRLPLRHPVVALVVGALVVGALVGSVVLVSWRMRDRAESTVASPSREQPSQPLASTPAQAHAPAHARAPSGQTRTLEPIRIAVEEGGIAVGDRPRKPPREALLGAAAQRVDGDVAHVREEGEGLGFLRFDSHLPEASEIRIDGRLWSSNMGAKDEDGVGLPPGRHVVTLQHRGTGVTRSVVVTIQPNSTETLTLDAQ
ncbi:MAG: serine/threonine protein kinase [Deltaproteobacteria bacterium]|nr:serine/threonine protein kinase [Deltaproteobacteria bacterium]